MATDKGVMGKILSSENVCQLPISGTANAAIDNGVPICLSRPDEAKAELDSFQKLATIVSRELFQLPHRKPSSEGMVLLEDQYFDLSTVQMSADGDSLMIRFFSENGALQKKIASEKLRYRDPMSGEIQSDQAMDNDSVVVSTYKSNASANDDQAIRISPERIEEKGRVGFEVTWSDGSRYIYRRSVIALAAGGDISES